MTLPIKGMNRMRIVRSLLAMPFAALLCGAAMPKIETSIVVATPIKVIKYLGLPLNEEEGDLSTSARFLVKMKTNLVVEGSFPKRIFTASINSHMAEYIFDTREYVIFFRLVDGKYQDTGYAPVDRYYCLAEEDFKKIGTLPEELSRITDSEGRDYGVKCSRLADKKFKPRRE